MKTRNKLHVWCFIVLVVVILLSDQCYAKGGSRSRGSSRKSSSSSSGRYGNRGSGNSGGNTGGSWWSRVFGGSSAPAKPAKVTNTKLASKPEASAPVMQPSNQNSKPIGWNVPPKQQPGAPPAYSGTNVHGQSNLNAAPPAYSKNNPPGHQTLGANPSYNQPPNANYPRANYPQSNSYPGGYPAGGYPAGGYQQHGYGAPPPSYGGYPGGMAGGYNPAAYPAIQPVYVGGSRTSSGGGTLTNALLAGSLGLGIYNAIRPGYGGGYGGGYGNSAAAYPGNTVHHHYYNNNSDNPGGQANQNIPIQQPIPMTNMTNGMPQQPQQQMIPSQNGLMNPTPTPPPPPPPMVPNYQISELDCMYAMKILNCSELKLCPQDALHPACLNMSITPEKLSKVELPPPPPPPPMQPYQPFGSEQPASVDPSQHPPNNQMRNWSYGNEHTPYQSLEPATSNQHSVRVAGASTFGIDKICLITPLLVSVVKYLL